MNAERLLQHFHRISEAPDAIPRLRRFILDLAVRGKLVEQDPNDEPAMELLKRIEKKVRLVKEGKIKKEPIFFGKESVPFSLPTSWSWARFIEVAAIESNLVKPDSFPDYPHIAPDNIEGRTGRLLDYQIIRESKVFSAKHRFFPGHIVYSKIRPNLAKAALVDFEGLCSADMYPIRPFIDRAFLHKFMLSEAFVQQSIKEDNRVAMPKINQESLSRILVVVPPLAEQHRIVARVDELMALCDQLEAAKANREQSRDRLVAASLHRLNPPADAEEANTPEAFRDHARFIFTHLPRLTTRPEHIKQLRQTILNLAVRGKLVEQAPNDEPAAELLKRIQAEKARLVKTGKIRNQELFESIEESEIPFQIPETWEWVPATFPVYLISDMGKKVQTKDVLESGEFPVIDQGKVFIRGYCNDRSKVIHIEAPIVLFGDHTRETKLIDFDFVVGADGVKLLHPVGLLTDYYYLALRWLPLDSRGYGRHFKLLRAARLPLPPLAEQHRIVAKVDELMALCDQLESQLITTEADSRLLLEAMLHEALALEETA